MCLALVEKDTGLSCRFQTEADLVATRVKNIVVVKNEF
jgi:hypothetical protein